MVLIVESGATKSNWILIQGGKIMHSMQLPGINITSNPQSIQHVNTYAEQNTQAISEIHFYGAGVSTQTVVDKLENRFKSFFGDIVIEVHSDILAASRSVSADQQSIVAILGTGTNAVLFDGKEIVKDLNALGYLFNDFGCAFHLGQLTINEYYFNRMSAEDKEIFESQFLVSRPEFKRTIYLSDKPNYEIGQCAKVLSLSSPELIDKITRQAFNAFFDNHIKYLTESKEYKLNFIGSISKVFETQLRSVAYDHGYSIGQIVADPIDGLINYHMQYENRS